MKDVAGQGRAVLLVNHSMPTIEQLCERAIWIDRGRLAQDGMVKKVVADYIDIVNLVTEVRKVGEYQNFGHWCGSGGVQFPQYRLMDSNGVNTRSFTMGEIICLGVDVQAHKDIGYAVFGFGVVDTITQVFVANWFGYHESQSLRAGERGTFSITLPDNSLQPRRYYFYLGIIGNSNAPYDIWDGVGTEFSVNYPADVESLMFSVGSDVTLSAYRCMPSFAKGESGWIQN